MVPEECVAPGGGERRCTEETEVVRVFVEDFLTVYQVSEEVVCEAAAEDLFVALGRGGGF